MSIRQAKIHGEVIVAKPVLLLALIDGVDGGVFTTNQFTLNDWLEEKYLALMKQYTRNSQFDKPADISNPFWHLQSDGFWHLLHKPPVADGSTPTKRWLKENITYGHFDDDLWVLLQNKVWRQKLRDYIVEHKLTDDSWCSIINDIKRIKIMRHRIKAGKVGSFTPEKQKVEIEQLDDREVAEGVEEIFEEDSEFSNDDEALAAMGVYDNPDEME